MMRKLRGILLALAVALLLTGQASAAVEDGFETALGDDWRQYGGLTGSMPSIEAFWPGSPDASTLSVEMPGQGAAWALYAVDGAHRVEVAMYSFYSTIAVPRSGEYVMGAPDAGAHEASGLLIGDDGRIYLQAQGWRTAAYDEQGQLSFIPLAAKPTAELHPYGLSVSCSKDNKTFTEVKAALKEIRCSLKDGAAFPCFYQTYQAELPQGVRYIRLELREAGFFPVMGGGSQINRAKGSMRFAHVRFPGGTAGSLTQPPPSSKPEPPLGSSDSSDPPVSSSESLDGSGNAPQPSGSSQEPPERPSGPSTTEEEPGPTSSTGSGDSGGSSDPDLPSSSGSSGASSGRDPDLQTTSQAPASSRSSRSSRNSRESSSPPASSGSSKQAASQKEAERPIYITIRQEAPAAGEPKRGDGTEKKSAEAAGSFTYAHVPEPIWLSPQGGGGSDELKTKIAGGIYLVFAACMLVAVSRKRSP